MLKIHSPLYCCAVLLYAHCKKFLIFLKIILNYFKTCVLIHILQRPDTKVKAYYLPWLIPLNQECHAFQQNLWYLAYLCSRSCQRLRIFTKKVLIIRKNHVFYHHIKSPLCMVLGYLSFGFLLISHTVYYYLLYNTQ